MVEKPFTIAKASEFLVLATSTLTSILPEGKPHFELRSNSIKDREPVIIPLANPKSEGRISMVVSTSQLAILKSPIKILSKKE